jgi:hypothetical protein
MPAAELGIAAQELREPLEIPRVGAHRAALPSLPLDHARRARRVAAGTPGSYGATYRARRATTIATVPIGYAEGYPRALSNVGHMIVAGRRVPIAGRVCMDFTMLDVGEAGVAEGDEVRREHLPERVTRGRERRSGGELRTAMKAAEKAALLEVLAATRWNVTEAAKRLGVTRSAVIKAALQLDGVIAERWCRPPLRSVAPARLDHVRTALRR